MPEASRLISPQEAHAAILRSVASLGTETVPLERLSGRILKQSIAQTRAQPPFDRVTMDGVAIASAEFAAGRRTFRIAGTQAAGAAPQFLSDARECLEVMTGAVLPTGTDCVVPVERITVTDGVARIHDDVAVAPLLNVHTCGLDARAGDQLLTSGRVLGAAEIAAIASTGLATVSVAKVPRIAVISTGDELVEPGKPVEDWQIYRSNAYALAASLQERRYTDLVHDHVRDDLATLRTRLAVHLGNCDALILSGGVSMGQFDFVPRVLNELGVRTLFHQVAQRPGKPMWFGIGPAGQAVYALPGNPVSTLVCLVRYVLAGLDVAAGRAFSPPQDVELAEDYEVKPALAFFTPAVLDRRHENARASLRPTRGSGDFISLLGTEGFVELPKGPHVATSGSIVPFYAW